MYELDGRRAPEQLALVLPTSLCSGQVALRLADQAAAGDWTRGRATRTVALPHTEGCGVSSGPAENTYARMMTGYLAHPNVGAGAAAGARLREDPQRLLPLPAGRGGAGPVALRVGQHPARRRHRGRPPGGCATGSRARR